MLSVFLIAKILILLLVSSTVSLTWWEGSHQLSSLMNNQLLSQLWIGWNRMVTIMDNISGIHFISWGMSARKLQTKSYAEHLEIQCLSRLMSSTNKNYKNHARSAAAQKMSRFTRDLSRMPRSTVSVKHLMPSLECVSQLPLVRKSMTSSKHIFMLRNPSKLLSERYL